MASVAIRLAPVRQSHGTVMKDVSGWVRVSVRDFFGLIDLCVREEGFALRAPLNAAPETGLSRCASGVACHPLITRLQAIQLYPYHPGLGMHRG